MTPHCACLDALTEAMALPEINMEADVCVCGHRQYDHLTEDGSCWKCRCAWFAAVPDQAPLGDESLGAAIRTAQGPPRHARHPGRVQDYGRRAG